MLFHKSTIVSWFYCWKILKCFCCADRKRDDVYNIITKTQFYGRFYIKWERKKLRSLKNLTERLEVAHNIDIIIVCSRSHTTEAMQPLDQAFFKPGNHYSKQEARLWMIIIWEDKSQGSKQVNWLVEFGRKQPQLTPECLDSEPQECWVIPREN
jgi:hypothetical protein